MKRLALLALPLLAACAGTAPCPQDPSSCAAPSAQVSPRRVAVGSRAELSVTLSGPRAAATAETFEVRLTSPRGKKSAPFTLRRSEGLTWRGVADLSGLPPGPLFLANPWGPGILGGDDLCAYHPAPLIPASPSLPLPQQGCPSYLPTTLYLEGSPARALLVLSTSNPDLSQLACRYELQKGLPVAASQVQSPLEPLGPSALAAFSGNRAWATPRHFFALPFQRIFQLHACPEAPGPATCAEVDTGVDYATSSGLHPLRSLVTDPVGRVLALSNPTPDRGGLELFLAGTGPEPSITRLQQEPDRPYGRLAFAYLGGPPARYPDLAAVSPGNVVTVWRFDDAANRYAPAGWGPDLGAAFSNQPVQALAAGDVDGDRQVDLVLGAGRTIRFLLNQGCNNDASPRFELARYSLEAAGPVTALAVERWDEDDAPDVVVASGNGTTPSASVQVFMSRVGQDP